MSKLLLNINDAKDMLTLEAIKEYTDCVVEADTITAYLEDLTNNRIDVLGWSAEELYEDFKAWYADDIEDDYDDWETQVW